MNKFTAFIQKAILLALVYLLITSNLEFANLITAFLVGLGVSTLIPERLLFISWRRLPGALLAGMHYVLVLIVDMLKSGIQVGRLLLNPALPIKPGIITVYACCESEFSIALSAHAITLTPGELVVEMDDQGELFTHCLDVTNSKEYSLAARQIRQDILIKIFE